MWLRFDPIMRSRKLIVLVVFGAVTLHAIAQTNNSQNPAFPRQRFERDEERVHDPSTIVKCKDDYWVFLTGPGIGSRHSTDLLKWTNGPRVFETVPSWTTDTIPGN